MEKANKVIFTGLLIFTLTVPTSAFAESNDSFRNYNSFETFLEQFFLSFLGSNESSSSTGKAESDRDNDDWKKGNDNHHDHEKHENKNKNKSCTEMDSAKIWKWYYGYEKEWGHCKWGEDWDKDNEKDWDWKNDWNEDDDKSWRKWFW